ncbi:terminase large subunit [Ruminococcus sp. AF17-6LB]|uniref:terminase large subunit n=1 Tax=unclassified Ruminococcus TaxID=2608920 RepID=UPI000E51634A|nr:MULTISPECIES: terminase large subunit [unclassified Ruminococcus]RGG72160.1 terminase large subunit [Ruminococcus sp. AF17-6LB]RGG73900.1 terminase large subunit [Ruminococcus sp. AF17-6]RGG80972.1 terminase large subunit [Ruminococcus sp. AF17-1AC]
MNYIREYVELIKRGKIKTSARVRKVYTRLLKEIDRPPKNFKYYFDEETGERPISFIETFCKQSQGDLGAPLELELFQRAYIQALFGFLDKETGYRRFRETMFLVGRKNGKTTLMAGIALYLLTADYEGAAEIYSVATKKDQARKALTEAVNMIKQSPELRALLKKRRNDVYFAATSSKFEALASDSNTLDGLNSHGVIIDELHAIRDRNLYEVMKQSTSSRRQPLIVMITTAGTVRECIFDDMYEYACRVADGEEVDEAFLPILYELDERSEWLDPKMWIKANPGLGKIKQVETLRSFVERAKKNPADRAGVLCKDFNVRENDSTAWLPFDVINNEATFDLADVYDTYAIGGCDLSSTTDLTCATLLIRKPNDKTVYVLQHYFLPQARIDELADKKQRSGGHSNDEAPYKLWAERGLLTACQGARVNYSDVTAWFVQMRERYKIDCWKCGYDRALAGYWVDEMTANGFTMDKVIQGTYTFSQPMRELGAALQDKLVNYNNNPVLKWCLSNTGKKEQGLNNIMPVKISEKRRIDGMVSLLNAWVVYVRDYEDYMYNVG